MQLCASSEIVAGQCGIGAIFNIFQIQPGWDVKDYGYVSSTTGIFRGTLLEKLKHKGGAGFVGTGFINTSVSKASYEILCKNKRLIFQTPVRMNKNSGNMFFYAMFDDHNNPEEDGYLPTLEPYWPFKDVK